MKVLEQYPGIVNTFEEYIIAGSNYTILRFDFGDKHIEVTTSNFRAGPRGSFGEFNGAIGRYEICLGEGLSIDEKRAMAIREFVVADKQRQLPNTKYRQDIKAQVMGDDAEREYLGLCKERASSRQ